MKKLISILLVFFILFSMSGCFFNECSLCGEEETEVNPVKKRKYYGKECYMCELCWLEYMVELADREVQKYY